MATSSTEMAAAAPEAEAEAEASGSASTPPGQQLPTLLRSGQAASGDGLSGLIAELQSALDEAHRAAMVTPRLRAAAEIETPTAIRAETLASRWHGSTTQSPAASAGLTPPHRDGALVVSPTCVRAPVAAAIT